MKNPAHKVGFFLFFPYCQKELIKITNCKYLICNLLFALIWSH